MEVVVQAVFDIRRSIDLLEEYGVRKVALVGRSLGNLVGAVTLGVDNRISVGALIATGGNLTYILHNGNISEKQDVDVERILSHPWIEYTEPLNYIGNFNGSLQLHYAEDDKVIPPQACIMLNESAVNCKKKEVIQHPGGHDIPDKEVNDYILNLLKSDLVASEVEMTI